MGGRGIENSRADPHNLFYPGDVAFGSCTRSDLEHIFCSLPQEANQTWQWERIGRFASEVHSVSKTPLQEITALSPVLPERAQDRGHCDPRAHSYMLPIGLGLSATGGHKSTCGKHHGMTKVKN